MPYRGYVLQDEDLVSMRQILSDKINETMKKCLFFRSIMPPKIFTDMYQFYQAQHKVQADLNQQEY